MILLQSFWFPLVCIISHLCSCFSTDHSSLIHWLLPHWKHRFTTLFHLSCFTHPVLYCCFDHRNAPTFVSYFKCPCLDPALLVTLIQPDLWVTYSLFCLWFLSMLDLGFELGVKEFWKLDYGFVRRGFMWDRTAGCWILDCGFWISEYCFYRVFCLAGVHVSSSSSVSALANYSPVCECVYAKRNAV